LNLVLSKLPKETKFAIRLPDGIFDALTYAEAHLKGARRRIFMAETVCSIGEGGQRTAEKALRWNRSTIRKGMHELQSGIHCIENFSRRGRKLFEVHIINREADETEGAYPLSRRNWVNAVV